MDSIIATTDAPPDVLRTHTVVDRPGRWPFINTPQIKPCLCDGRLEMVIEEQIEFRRVLEVHRHEGELGAVDGDSQVVERRLSDPGT